MIFSSFIPIITPAAKAAQALYALNFPTNEVETGYELPYIQQSKVVPDKS
jgi:hypothetical protein